MICLSHTIRKLFCQPLYRFNDRILIYNTRRDKWEEVVRSQDVARAGAALTGQGQTFFNINGELKPGIRTPEIAKIMID